MASRWKLKEEEALKEIRVRLKDELAARPQFPEGKDNDRLLAEIDETLHFQLPIHNSGRRQKIAAFLPRQRWKDG